MAVYFTSDLHLHDKRPDLIRAFIRFIDQISSDADQLFLLGDIFEAWIGDDYPPPEIIPVLEKLKTLSDSHSCRVYFQHGNRDFLVGADFLSEYGIQLIKEYHLVQLGKYETLLLHGDQLCTDDTDYIQFRNLVRNPVWQQDFLAKSIEDRLMIAQQLRQKSKESATEKSDEIMDVNQQAVLDTIQSYGVATMIHGHTHRPNIHDIDQRKLKAKRIVLGDWDQYLWYAKWDGKEIELIKATIN